MKTQNRLSLGSVVEGTTKAEDTVEGLVWWLGYYKPELTAEQQTELARFLELLELGEPHPEAPEVASQTLQEWMEALAPPYTYFGTHPGDGADLGFWVDWSGIETDLHDGSLLRAENLPAGHVGLALEVNERGNTTLWEHRSDGTCVEVWGVV